MQISKINAFNVQFGAKKDNTEQKSIGFYPNFDEIPETRVLTSKDIVGLYSEPINTKKPIMVEIGPNTDIMAYSNLAKKAVGDISKRAGVQGQFLSWIGKLPEEEIENLDSIYETVKRIKGKNEELAIIGIGGSRNPLEFLITAFNLNDKVHFYSSGDTESFNRFMDKLNIDKTQFMVVSKSGTTLEPSHAQEEARKYVQSYFNKKDVSDKFIAMTDKNSATSALRKAVNNGDYIASGLIHDDVGGRFSIFDDPTIFTLAYLGVPKEDVKSMLKASLEAQKDFMNPDITKNEALQLAAFNTRNILGGKQSSTVYYFGDAFNGAINWEKQLKNESLKSHVITDVNVGPAFLHYNAEGDLDDGNNRVFYTFVHVANDKNDKNAKVQNAIFNGSKNAYLNHHKGAVSSITLKDYSMETLARFIEMKHFETLYTGNMYRQLQKLPNKENALDEVLQPNVEKYKKEVKKILEGA